MFHFYLPYFSAIATSISQQESIWGDFRTDMHRDPYGSPSKRPDVQ